MAIIKGLSQDASCRVLVTQMLHSDSISFDLLSNSLALEDVNRERNPTLYGLERTAEGVLVAAGASPASASFAKGRSGPGSQPRTNASKGKGQRAEEPRKTKLHALRASNAIS